MRTQRVHPVIRASVAIAAGLIASIIAARLVGWIALAVLRMTGPRDGVVLLGVMANLVVVPSVGGLVIGSIADRWLLLLSAATVGLSLIGTYFSLGTGGLPHGVKIVSYLLQLALIYLAARAAARGRDGPSSISMRTA